MKEEHTKLPFSVKSMNSSSSAQGFTWSPPLAVELEVFKMHLSISIMNYF